MDLEEDADARVRSLEQRMERIYEWQRLREGVCDFKQKELDKIHADISDVEDTLRREVKVEAAFLHTRVGKVEDEVRALVRSVSKHAGIGAAVGALVPAAVGFVIWLLNYLSSKG